MKKLTGYFINGFLVFVQAAATICLVKWSMEFIDGLMPFDVPGVELVVLFLLFIKAEYSVIMENCQDCLMLI